MKVGIIYTATTPESVAAINAEIRKKLGERAEIINYQDATILDEVCAQGYVTAHAAARLVSMFMQAISDGVDAMLSCCSTLPTTLEPTKNTLLRAAREMNRRVTLVDGLMPGAFGIKQDVFKKMICDKAAEMIDQVDVILLAQGSMTYTEEILAERLKKPVLSSPRFGVAALAKALEAKGLQ